MRLRLGSAKWAHFLHHTHPFYTTAYTATGSQKVLPRLREVCNTPYSRANGRLAKHMLHGARERSVSSVNAVTPQVPYTVNLTDHRTISTSPPTEHHVHVHVCVAHVICSDVEMPCDTTALFACSNTPCRPSAKPAWHAGHLYLRVCVL